MFVIRTLGVDYIFLCPCEFIEFWLCYNFAISINRQQLIFHLHVILYELIRITDFPLCADRGVHFARALVFFIYIVFCHFPFSSLPSFLSFFTLWPSSRLPTYFALSTLQRAWLPLTESVLIRYMAFVALKRKFHFISTKMPNQIRQPSYCCLKCKIIELEPHSITNVCNYIAPIMWHVCVATSIELPSIYRIRNVWPTGIWRQQNNQCNWTYANEHASVSVYVQCFICSSCISVISCSYYMNDL